MKIKLAVMAAVCLPVLFAQTEIQGLVVRGTADISGATISKPSRVVGSDPSGACSNNNEVVLSSVTGNLFSCLSGAWHAASGSGGTGSPGGSTNAIQINSAGSFGGLLNTTGTRQFVISVSSGATLGVLQASDIPSLTSSTISDFSSAVAALAAMPGGANTYTGYNNFSGASIRLPETVVGSLPTASANTGKVYVVTDASTAGSCTSGSGTARSICRSNGTIWESIGGAPGGGGGPALQLNGAAVSDATANFMSGTGVNVINGGSSGGVKIVQLDTDTAVIPTKAVAQAGSMISFTTTGGTTAYLGAMSPTLTAYTDKMLVTIKFNVACTGTPTLAIDTLPTPVGLYASDGTTVASGSDCDTVGPKLYAYNSTGPKFIRIGGGTGGGGGTTVSAAWPYVTIGGTNYLGPYMFQPTLPPTTWSVNENISTTTYTATGSGGAYLLNANSSGSTQSCRFNPITTETSLTAAWTYSGTNGTVGVALQESSTGKTLFVSSYISAPSSGAQINWIPSIYWQYATWSGSTWGATTTSNVYAANLTAGHYSVQVDWSTSNVVVRQSGDDTNFAQMDSLTKSTFFTSNPDRVGVCITDSNANGRNNMATLLHFRPL
jgi:hypothetical protein